MHKQYVWRKNEVHEHLAYNEAMQRLSDALGLLSFLWYL